ncbi:MAG: hypothetical protein KDC85_08830 [Saprospiraceae bacterium]|nr:hypothetical protein [Saprospiraceae bacterium]MCB9324765.1 hypothetical protein [Lewinellaceae bacterium]
MNKLDDFIKGKMEQRQFEFDEAHWHQAAAMLETQGRKRRKIFWFCLLSGQILLLGLVFAFWQTGLDSTGFSIENNQAVAEQTDRRETLKSSGPQRLPATKSNEINDLGKKTPSTVQVLPAKRDQKQNPTLSKEPNNKTDQQELTPNLDKKKNPLASNGATLPAKVSNTPIAPALNKETLFTNDHEAKEDQPPVKDQIMVDEMVFKKEDFGSTLILKLPILDFLVQTKNRAVEGDIAIPDPLPLFKNQLNIFAATTLYPYVSAGGKNVIGYTAGVNYAGFLKKAWGFEAGIYYRLRQGTFSKSATTEQITYAFSRSIEQFFALPEQIHTLEIPVAVTFSRNRHTVSAGVNFSYLLGLKGTLNRQGSGESFPAGQGVQILERGWIDTAGFNPKHWDAFGAWYFAVDTKISLGARLHYTFGSVLEHPESGIYLESNPFFFDVGLRYNLFSR